MADLSFNGIVNPQGIVIFDQCPNIININEVKYGSKAIIQIVVGSVPVLVLRDGQYSITVMGETVTNVISRSNENGKRFKLYQDRAATAVSIASALRNCQKLISLFNIYTSGRSIYLEAREIGTLNVSVSSNLGSRLGISVSEGDVFSQLYGQNIIADVSVDGEYKTTLEKRMYGEDCSFDISQVLSPYAEYGKLKPFDVSLKAIDTSGALVDLGQVDGNITPGYLVTGSEPFLYNTEPQLLIGRKEGLTTFGDVLELSVLSPTSYTLNYQIVSPDGTVLESSTESVSSTGLTDFFFWMGQPAMSSGSVVNVSAGTDTAQFRIIKPLKAADGFERLCWRNEYGGVSFFDFTGRDSQTYSLSKKTYNKSWFDFYTNDSFEHEKMADDDTRTEFTLRSHLLTQEEAEQFRSLSRASSVWLAKKEWDEVSEEMMLVPDRRHVILTGLDVTENDTYPGVWVATVKYKLSSEK